MVQKRAEIYPNSTFFQCFKDGINIVEDVVSSVQKEAGCDSLEIIRSLVVNFCKFTCYNSKIELLLRYISQHFSWTYFRYKHTAKEMFFVVVIVWRVDERIYFELLLVLSAVYDGVGSK